jgi:hypothetical protein
MLIAGDLTDGPRSWNLMPMLTAFYRDVSNWFDWYGMVHTYAVRGQHDTYMRNTDMNHKTMMGVIVSAGFIKELSSDPVVFTNAGVALYGSSWGDKLVDDPYFASTIDRDMTNILVIHAPISDQSAWEGQNFFHAERFLKDNNGFNLILCGDIHRMFMINHDHRWICNTGPMIRKTADQYNFTHEPCLFVYDTQTNDLKRVKIPHRPAKEVLNRGHIAMEEARVRSILDMDKFVERVKAARSGQYKATTFENNLSQLVAASNARQSVVDLLREVTKCQLQNPQRIKV